MSSSRGSSHPSEGTQVSCITGRFLTIWATWEAEHLGREQKAPREGRIKEPGAVRGGVPRKQAGVESGVKSYQGGAGQRRAVQQWGQHVQGPRGERQQEHPRNWKKPRSQSAHDEHGAQ